MSFDPDTVKPRRVQTAPQSSAEPEVEGNGAPLAHKKERQTATLQKDDQTVIETEVNPHPEGQDDVRRPRGAHDGGSQATVDELEHAVHPGIF